MNSRENWAKLSVIEFDFFSVSSTKTIKRLYYFTVNRFFYF